MENNQVFTEDKHCSNCRKFNKMCRNDNLCHVYLWEFWEAIPEKATNPSEESVTPIKEKTAEEVLSECLETTEEGFYIWKEPAVIKAMKTYRNLGNKIREIKTISQLAEEIKSDINGATTNSFQKRLNDTLDRFNHDFRFVIEDLISCNVKIEPCFLYENKDDYYLFPQQTLFKGNPCTCNSILFTFEHNGKIMKKRLFYNQDDYEGWYYIAVQGNFINAKIFIRDYRRDLILFLDGTFDGEYK